MIRVLALDDEPLALQQLTRYLEKVPFFEVVGSCLSVAEAMRQLDTEPGVDALFLDINMPDLNGMEFVRSLIHPPLVVFATAYSEYALEGYRVSAVDYLLKPYGQADILAAANKVKQRYDLLHAAPARPADAAAPDAAEPAAPQVPKADADSIFLKTDYKVVRVRISDIVYIKGMSEYLRIYTTTHPKPIIALLSMKKIEDRLAPCGFMRVHRSYIVALKHVGELCRTGIVLDTGEEIPIGDTYKAAISEYVRGMTMNT